MSKAVDSVVEITTKLLDYSNRLEKDKTDLMEVVLAACAWSDLNHGNPSMDEAIVVADRLEQAVANLRIGCSVELLKELVEKNDQRLNKKVEASSNEKP
jgi:hypothetical protein